MFSYTALYIHVHVDVYRGFFEIHHRTLNAVMGASVLQKSGKITLHYMHMYIVDSELHMNG